MLSILTVSYNSGHRLKAWLDALTTDPPQTPHEIVIAENASTDGSADFLRGPLPPYVKVVWLPRNRLYTGGANAAFAASKGELVLYLNADVRPLPGAIDALVSRLRSDPTAGGVAGATLRPSDMTFEKYVNRFPRPYDLYLTNFVRREKAERNAGFRRYHMLDDDLSQPCEVPQPAGHCILLRRELLPDPPMDAGFGLFFSDVEVATHVYRSGRRILLDPAARFVHDHDRTSRPASERSLLVDLDYYTGCARYFRRYVGLGAALQVKLLFGARLLGRLLLVELPAALRGEQDWSLWRQRARVLGWFLIGRNVLRDEAKLGE